jgi:tetratricopeptide (TPR) repeat protein
MGDNLFDDLPAMFQNATPETALNALADRLKSEGRYKELFDTRLLQTRLRFGLPIAESASLESLPEATRAQVEQDYLDACREAGGALLEQGRLREAWRYLQATGQRPEVAAALANIAVDEANVEQLVEVALYEGVAPELGFQHLLTHYGVCNAITAMDTVVYRLPLSVRQTTAGMLVRQLYKELMANIRREFDDRGEVFPEELTLGELVAKRANLFADQGCHVDASHLSAVARLAEVVEDSAVVRLALELCQYGRLLHANCQFPGDDPFGDTYADHQRFFAAQLGIDVEDAVAFFEKRAVRAANENVNAYPAEVYVALLARLGRYQEAIDASIRFLTEPGNSTGLAPSLVTLCEQIDDYSALMDQSRRKGDLVGCLVALVLSTTAKLSA